MKSLAAALLVALLAAPALAGMPPGGTPGDDPFARFLFSPDVIMEHTLDIGLEDAQRATIKNEVQKAQPKFLDSKFELQGEGQKMIRLLQEKPVDENKVLAQVDRILALEREIKRTQISLLVRLRNVLTPEQQNKLTAIQKTPGN